jgi:hypothetical protein
MDIDNSSLEMVEAFSYLGTAANNQNYAKEKNKSRLKSENASYRAVQSLMAYILLSKYTKNTIYRSINLHFFWGV